MNSISAFGKAVAVLFSEALHWVLLFPDAWRSGAGQNGHSLPVIGTSCGKLLSTISVIICDSNPDFCQTIARHVAKRCVLPL
jgi:hypothetical protein